MHFGLSSSLHQHSRSSSAEAQLTYSLTILQLHWFRNLMPLSLDRCCQGNFADAGLTTRGGSQWMQKMMKSVENMQEPHTSEHGSPCFWPLYFPFKTSFPHNSWCFAQNDEWRITALCPLENQEHLFVLFHVQPFKNVFFLYWPKHTCPYPA